MAIHEEPGRPQYFQNVATGNAHVGVQMGQNTGTVSVHQASQPGYVELDRLVRALRQAHRDGAIDAGTLSDSEHELEVTRAALAEPGDEGRGRAKRALQRVAGMLDGVAGLGAIIGSAVAAVEALS
ncbi:hypothetical protein [Actinoplanes solisilvae]|uniref:hypothetical protein n=1 Tax=Actinoplanes solisilvae TaxID=2486853 RepID=UPI000FD83224|nr:hypothetical protein [Actinoplanes solisilvae]